MYGSPREAYEMTGKATVSSRELEAAALFKTARMMEASKDGCADRQKSARLQDALRQNLRLWTLFQGELARSDHEMPAGLRRDLLTLSAFVDRRTFEAMATPEPEKIQTLIDINRQIALGLATGPE